MINKAKEFIFSPAIYGTLIVSIGLIIGSVFAYLLQFFLGRLLSTEQFGTFNALLSVGNIASVPIGILSASLIKISSELLGKGDFEKLTLIFWKILFYSSLAGFLVFLLVAIYRFEIGEYLNIFDPTLILIFGIFIGIPFFGVVPMAYLQGLLRYKGYSFSVAINGVIRFTIPIVLVYMGYQLRGAYSGMIVSGILTYIIALFILKKNLTSIVKSDIKPYYKKILEFSLPVFFIQFGMLALNNVDIILVKRFFDGETAGYYAGTVTLGKIFLFGASMLVTVMFPQISSLYAKGEDYSKRFRQFLSLQIFIVIVGVAAFYLLPNLITLVFFGDKFLNSVQYLPRFSIFIGLYVITNFMVMFLLAIEKTKVFVFLVPAVLYQFILINTYHSSLYQIININSYVSLVLLLFVWLYFELERKTIHDKKGTLA